MDSHGRAERARSHGARRKKRQADRAREKARAAWFDRVAEEAKKTRAVPVRAVEAFLTWLDPLDEQDYF